MRSLVSYLNERTPQELRVVAEHWEVSLSERLYAGNTFQLSQEITNSFLQRRLLEKLDIALLKLLGFILNAPDNKTSIPDIAKNLDLEEAKVNHLVGELRQVGLVFDEKVIPDAPNRKGWGSFYRRLQQERMEEPANVNTAVQTPIKPELRVPRELARPLKRTLNEYLISKGEIKPNAPVINRSRLPLFNLLLDIEPEIVEQEADTWGIFNLSLNQPEKLAEEMVMALADPKQQAKVLESISHDSRELFDRLKKHGHTTITALLEDYVSLRRLGRTIRPLIDHLLVWESFENGESVAFVPSEIAVPHTTTANRNAKLLQTTVEPPTATKFPYYALAWDALTFLNYLGQNEVELTQNDYIPKRHLKKLAVKLWKPVNQDEMARLTFLIDLCRYLRLYREDFEPSRLLLLGEDFSYWLGLDIYEQNRQFFKLWLETPHRVNPVTFPLYYSDSHYVEKANRAILEWLAECEPNIWYTTTSFTAKIRYEDPYFIRPRRDLLNNLGAARLEHLERIWDKIEGEIVRATLGSALEWLGVVRVERSEEGEVRSFALTDFGAEMVGRSETSEAEIPAEKKILLVQPNFDVLLFVPQVGAIWKLLKFAEIKKLDRVCIFNVNRESVLRGLETGLTASIMLEWLAEHSTQPLPQNLSTSIQDWSKGFKRVTLERTTLLEVEDPRVLDELLKMKQYAPYFVRRLSPTAAIVKLPETNGTVDPLRTLRNVLRNDGFFAK